MSTYYQKNREEIIRKQRERDLKRKDEIAAYQKQYRSANIESRKQYHAAYYAAHREEMKQLQAEYYTAHREYYKALNSTYYLRNREELLAASRAYYSENREQVLAEKRKYYKQRKADFLSRNAMRRANEKQATPQWADRKCMAEIYREAANQTIHTGIIHHVHHIVPLKDHPLVCGLHTESNLQVLSEEDHWLLHGNIELLVESWTKITQG